MALDPRIEAIRKEYDLDKDAFWNLPQAKNTWCVKHSALEIVAAKAGIVFAMPQIIEANGAGGVAAVCVQGTMGDRSIWSIGEANPKNSRNAYPWAMAEKRAIDRVILKLVGIHGLVYSEEEIDSSNAPDMTKPDAKADSRQLHQNMLDKVIEAGRKGRSALRAYWTSEEFQAGWELMPIDWRRSLEEEKDAFLASYSKPTGSVDPNASLDQQFADTVGEPA